MFDFDSIYPGISCHYLQELMESDHNAKGTWADKKSC